MTNQQILEKAIRLAIEGGWKEQGIKWMFQLHELADNEDFDMRNPTNFNVLIFNHDFAKALWGEGTYRQVTSYMRESVDRDFGWEYHLKNMVVAPDPIAYLGEHL